MTGTLHKLTAGDGYTYLTRQVAAGDATNRGRPSLSEYYSAKGESPGRWMGSGLPSLTHTGGRTVPTEHVEDLWTVAAGSPVTETQMLALFGEGRHPNAEAISAYVTSRGVHGRAAQDAGKLGREFYIRTGEPEFQRALAVAFRDHNAAAGRHWNAPIDAPVRAEIRTTVARDMFTKDFGRAPGDDRELAGFIARETRPRTTAVAGYDLTFSPVKSVSALWAIAPLRLAEAIETAHDAAVADALAFIESHAAFTRTGTNGIAQVDTTGVLAAAFTHRDSRAGDPDLHTHVAVSNKVAHIDAHGVQRWLALDGGPLHRNMVAASELYNTRLEAHLAPLGLAFADVAPTERGKRPIREIIGMPTELLRFWSSRRAQVEARTAELSKQFHTTHGREPTSVEAIALAQQATLETREAKHEPRSLAEQRQAWHTQAVEVLGSTRDVTALLARLTSGQHRLSVAPITPQWLHDQAADVIATVCEQRATWNRHHVLAEAQRRVRASGHATPAHHDLAERITDTALGPQLSVPHAPVADAERDEPDTLRRRDGSSVYSRHGSATYTSTQITTAETRILAAARRTDGRRIGADDVALALADSAARGKTLNPGQAALVTEMAEGGRRVALALAPAGSGKTTAMAALSHAWRGSGGHVIGLAPTAAAAIELSGDLNAPTDTLAKYVHVAAGRPGPIPDWFTDIDDTTLLIVDEAGKAGTLELDAAITHALAVGASVRLIGDDGQLSSISAGGVLRDIAHHTDALTLSQLVRFHCAAEGAASLALRAGDPTGIGFYIDNHRVHVGSDHTAADMAYTAWHADHDAGRDSLLLAPTNAIVNELNARARLDRVAADDRAVGRETILSDHLAASIGDVIRTRRNNRALLIGTRDFVRNGYRYTITDVHPDGSLTARHVGTAHTVTLPADYVATDVTLGYATTIDSAQGLTAGHACHIVGAAALTRQLLYVALTRGRAENHLYMSTAEADPHRVLSPKATHPDTAVDVLTTVLARDDAQVSAATAARRARDPFTRLGAAATMYHDALGTAAETHLGATGVDVLTQLAEQHAPTITTAAGWPVLRAHLAYLATAGDDPATVLTTAIGAAGLHDAVDPAAVVDWRIDPTGGHSGRIGPLRWLPEISTALCDDPTWGPYLGRRATLVSELADDIRAAVATWTPATAPAWAKPTLAANPALAAEIAVFRAAHDVADADTRLLGAPVEPTRAAAVQRMLERHAVDAVGTVHPNAHRFHELIDGIEPRIRADGYWPALADHLGRIDRSRPDLAALLRRAAAQGPLPDELPAAALWWRLSGLLAPAALDTTHAHLRPDWAPELHAVFGSALAEHIAADPAWPGLVAAIAKVDPDTWTPAELLSLAAERLADAAADAPIAPYEYARMITYTIELFTGDHLAVFTHSAPLDDTPPLSADEEEQLPPDPGGAALTTTATTTLGDDRPPVIVPDDHAEREPPPDPDNSPDHYWDRDEMHGLDFADLPTQRPAVTLAPALADVHELRNQYHRAHHELTVLVRHVHSGTGPAMRAATAELAALRERAAADRPHLLAVQEVVAGWHDADDQYAHVQADVEWAHQQLAQLRSEPTTDELDIASAELDLHLRQMALPATSPAARFHPLLQDAHTRRAAAAGGAEHLVCDADVDTRIAGLRASDLRTLNSARTTLAQLRARLDQAETHAAAAFAAAETRSAQHLAAQHSELDAELRILAVAGTYDEHRPIHVPAILDGPDADPQPTPAALRTLAELPFTVTPVHARPGAERDDALRILRRTANAAHRNVLWCSPTAAGADRAAADHLADTSTTVADAHRHLIATGDWNLPPGALMVIDDAATVEPAMLADLAEHAATHHAGVIFIDASHPTWPPQPSSRLLTLLSTELRWTTRLSNEPHIAARPPTPPDLDPALTQARRVPADLLDDTLRAATARAEHYRTINDAAYHRHLKASWARSRGRVHTTDHGHHADLDD